MILLQPPETRYTVGVQPSKDAPRVTFVEAPAKRCISRNLTPIRTQAEGYFTPHPSNKNPSSRGICLGLNLGFGQW